MKRMTSKQIEMEAGRLLGKKWKQREQTGSLADQLRSMLTDDISDIDRESLQYLIDAADDLDE